MLGILSLSVLCFSPCEIAVLLTLEDSVLKVLPYKQKVDLSRPKKNKKKNSCILVLNFRYSKIVLVAQKQIKTLALKEAHQFLELVNQRSSGLHLSLVLVILTCLGVEKLLYQ